MKIFSDANPEASTDDTASQTAEIFEHPDKKEHETEVLAALTVDYTEEEERRVVRKLDYNLLTYVSALYLLSYLDRSNIGNAETAGMSKSLGISNNQYQWFLTIFYIGYISSQWLTFCWKLFPPRYYVPCVVIGWGILSTCAGAVQKWSDLMAIRFLLAVMEAGFGPGVPYYLTFFYYRHEVVFRTGIFISCSALASAFAGALAYGITKHKLAIDSWRVLFIVEGLPTVLVGVIGFLHIPNDPASCWFLNKREKEIAVSRMAKQTGETQRSHKLDVREVLKSMTDIKNLIPTLMFFFINVTFASLPVFMPQILKGLGYSSIRAQGLSAPPYIVTALAVILSSYISGRYTQRGLVITVMSSIGAAGFLILAVCNNTSVKYFAVYLAALGEFSCVAILLSWVGNNQDSDSRRSAGFVILQLIGQCGPVLGTRLYPERDAPHYRKGFWVCFGSSVFVAVASLCLRFHLARENRKLDEKYGKVSLEEAVMASDANAVGEGRFRYVL